MAVNEAGCLFGLLRAARAQSCWHIGRALLRPLGFPAGPINQRSCALVNPQRIYPQLAAPERARPTATCTWQRWRLANPIRAAPRVIRRRTAKRLRAAAAATRFGMTDSNFEAERIDGKLASARKSSTETETVLARRSHRLAANVSRLSAQVSRARARQRVSPMPAALTAHELAAAQRLLSVRARRAARAASGPPRDGSAVSISLHSKSATPGNGLARRSCLHS